MELRKIILPLLLGGALTHAAAADFLGTKDYRLAERKGRQSFQADVEFPTEGSPAAVKSVREWIGEILETEVDAQILASDFQKVLRQSFEAFVQENDVKSRKIEITRGYEDASVVTFVSTVTDKDSTTWRSEDCATFSKKDGHRLQASEIFDCPEETIKTLMWRYRGDLPTGVASASALVVGNVGFIDGWVIVIGPAKGYTGAQYRIRYKDAEPYLRNQSKSGYYGGADQ